MIGYDTAHYKIQILVVDNDSHNSFDADVDKLVKSTFRSCSTDKDKKI